MKNPLNTSFSAKTPQALLDDALSTFTKAEQKLNAAVAEVERQAEALEVQRATIDAKIEKATSVADRLKRISQRITDLVA